MGPGSNSRLAIICAPESPRNPKCLSLPMFEMMDAGLIASAQAVEHYEIARYGALIAWAKLWRARIEKVQTAYSRRLTNGMPS